VRLSNTRLIRVDMRSASGALFRHCRITPGCESLAPGAFVSQPENPMPQSAPTFRSAHRAAFDPTPSYEQRRGSARRRGYGSAWDRAARAFRSRYPLCLGCQAVGRTATCELVDHVIPHGGDEHLFWDEVNWQPACAWHHDVVKQQLERRYRAGRLAASALRLNSAEAKALTLRLDP
jgi:5-methylcytosine-specific restriction enzyme A